MELTSAPKRYSRAGFAAPSLLRQASFGLASATAILALGALVSFHPALALAVAGSGAVAGIYTGVARVPLAAILVVTALAVAGVVDLPRRYQIGSTTSYAWITALLALLLLLFSLSRYVLAALRGTGLVCIPLYAFAGWALLSMCIFRPTVAGIQNTFVYATFAALVPVTAAAVIRGDFPLGLARRAITCSIVVASVLEACNLALGGLNSNVLIGARSYALLGVVGVAWGIAHMRLGDRRYGLLVAVCWLLILLSLSRLAFAASLVVIVVSFLNFSAPANVVKSALAIGAIAAVAFVSVTHFGPLASRFSAQGDQTSVGGLSIDARGRTKLWSITWHSYLKSPIIGQGAGSSEIAILDALGQQSHPHNDYLRVLHDFGIVGLAILVTAFFALLQHAVRAIRRTRTGDPQKPVHVAGALALLALLLGMATDNAIVYLFVVVPVAAILGVSIGSFYSAEKREQAVP